MTSLTISIVNYKTPSLVVQCIDSLKAFPPTRATLHIAVVDNGSNDGSLGLIGKAHPDVELIDAGGNLGFAGGNNLVLRQATSDFVMLLNSDAMVEAGTLDRLLQTMDETPDAGAVGGRVVNASDGQDQDYPCRFPSLTGMIVRAVRGAEHPAAGHDSPVSMERLHGAGMMMRTSLLKTVGLLDDAFFMYDEDVDWCVRARTQGWKLLLVPGARVLHHGGASSGRAPSGQRPKAEASDSALRMRFELRRSRYLLYRKHRTTLELCVLKFLTDAVMVMHSVRSAAMWLVSGEHRAHAAALLRSNLKIIALNPFSLPSTTHGF